MNFCPATFRSFVVQWSAKIACRWPQLKPLPFPNNIHEMLRRNENFALTKKILLNVCTYIYIYIYIIQKKFKACRKSV